MDFGYTSSRIALFIIILRNGVQVKIIHIHSDIYVMKGKETEMVSDIYRLFIAPEELLDIQSFTSVITEAETLTELAGMHGNERTADFTVHACSSKRTLY